MVNGKRYWYREIRIRWLIQETDKGKKLLIPKYFTKGTPLLCLCLNMEQPPSPQTSDQDKAHKEAAKEDVINNANFLWSQRENMGLCSWNYLFAGHHPLDNECGLGINNRPNWATAFPSARGSCTQRLLLPSLETGIRHNRSNQFPMWNPQHNWS